MASNMRLCKLFTVIANEMEQPKRTIAYRLVRDILKLRRELNIRDDVADLLAKRHLLNEELGRKYSIVGLQELLRAIFELDTVWEYLVSKDALEPFDDDDTAFDHDNSEDSDDQDNEEDEDHDDEDLDHDEDLEEDEDVEHDEPHVTKYITFNYTHGTTFLTFVTLMNTVFSSLILCKLLM